MFYLFLFSFHYGGLAWVLRLFFRSHTHHSFLLWVSHLLFTLPYPLLHSALGIRLAFHTLIPTTAFFSGYYACFSALIPTTPLRSGYRSCFSAPIPTTPLCSGYLTYFSLSHTHIGAHNKTSYEAQAEINKTTASPKNTTFSEVYRYTIVIFPCFVI